MPRHLLRLCALLVLAASLRAGTFYVTEGQLDEFLLQQGADPRALSQELRRQSADKLLEHTVLAQAWNELGIPLTDEQLGELRRAHEEIAVRLAREAWTPDATASGDEVNDYFELSRYVYLAAHILVEKESLCQDLYRRLEQGEDFNELANTYSIDPGSAEQGAYLGPVHMGDTVAEFEDSLLALKEGSYSRPFETPFGWHIVYLIGTEPIDVLRNDAALKLAREQLERKRRRYAEKAATARLMEHLQVRFDFEHEDPGTLVVSARDTSLSRSRLDNLVGQAFAGSLSEEMLNEGLRQAYARHWIEQIGWLQVAREEGLWLGEELKDRIDVHERILKSALFVARELVPGIEVTQSDCYNYGDNHPGEFLDFRQYTFRRLVFADRQAAADARLGIEKQHFTPARAAEAYGNEKRQARDRGVPFELGPDERRRLPESQRSGLADISEGTWSSPIQHGNEWALWLLEGRRLPDLDESPALMAAVREKVRHLFLDAEIARVAERMKKAQDFDRVEILPDGAKQAGAAKAGRR